MTCSARSGLPDASRRKTSGEIRSALHGPLCAHGRRARRIGEHTDLARSSHCAERRDDELAGARRREHLDFAFEDDVRAIREVALAHQRLAWREHCSWLVNASSLRSDAERPLNSGTFCSISASSETSTPRLPALAGRATSAHRYRDPCRLRQNTAWPRTAKGHDVTTFGDEFYRDILEGIAVHADSAFHRDVLDTITRHQAPEIGVALNKNQMASKRWLADALFEAVGSRLGRVLILGGWVGALGAVLLHDRRFAIDGVVSIDIDPRCAPDRGSPQRDACAQTVDSTRATADMLDIDYAAPAGARDPPTSSSTRAASIWPEFDRWYARDTAPGQ